MKFLCIECDTAMKFKDVTRPEQGSVTAVLNVLTALPKLPCTSIHRKRRC